jgi:hypothetical protein
MPVRPLQYALKVFNLFKRTKEDGVLPPRPHQPTLRQVSCSVRVRCPKTLAKALCSILTHLGCP